MQSGECLVRPVGNSSAAIAISEVSLLPRHVVVSVFVYAQTRRKHDVDFKLWFQVTDKLHFL